MTVKTSSNSLSSLRAIHTTNSASLKMAFDLALDTQVTFFLMSLELLESAIRRDSIGEFNALLEETRQSLRDMQDGI